MRLYSLEFVLSGDDFEITIIIEGNKVRFDIWTPISDWDEIADIRESVNVFEEILESLNIKDSDLVVREFEKILSLSRKIFKEHQ